MTNDEILARLKTLERRLEAIEKGKPDPKPKIVSPFYRRADAIKLLRTRTILEDCEKGNWLVACIRKPGLVLYKRADLLACVYRISQGEYPTPPPH